MPCLLSMLRASESALIEPSVPNRASVRAFFLSLCMVADGAGVVGADGGLGDDEGSTMPANPLEGLPAGGGVEDGLEILSITERSKASALIALLGFLDMVFSVGAELEPAFGTSAAAT